MQMLLGETPRPTLHSQSSRLVANIQGYACAFPRFTASFVAGSRKVSGLSTGALFIESCLMHYGKLVV